MAHQGTPGVTTQAPSPRGGTEVPCYHDTYVPWYPSNMFAWPFNLSTMWPWYLTTMWPCSLCAMFLSYHLSKLGRNGVLTHIVLFCFVLFVSEIQNMLFTFYLLTPYYHVWCCALRTIWCLSSYRSNLTCDYILKTVKVVSISLSNVFSSDYWLGQRHFKEVSRPGIETINS